MGPETAGPASDRAAPPSHPPGPPAARQTLLDLIGGHRQTQLIYVATELGIADLVAEGLTSSAEVARAVGADPLAAQRLLRGLVVLGLLTEADGRFGLTPLGALLRRGAPDSLREDALDAGALHYPAWGALLHAVRTGRPGFDHVFGVGLFDYLAQHPEREAAFHRRMAAATGERLGPVLAYDFAGSRTVVDVGGGHGVLLAAVLRAHPHLTGVLFDLPQVVAGAGPVLRAAGVAPRCRVVGGSVFDAVPPGGDTYLLKSVLHDWDDERAGRILANCRRAVPERGTLLVAEARLPARPADVPPPVLASLVMLDLTMLTMTGGRERTGAEYQALLSAAGFRTTGAFPGLIEARPLPATEQRPPPLGGGAGAALGGR
jgi:hypothetical protein